MSFKVRCSWCKLVIIELNSNIHFGETLGLCENCLNGEFTEAEIQADLDETVMPHWSADKPSYETGGEG